MLSQRIRPQASRRAGQLRSAPLRAANMAGLAETSLKDRSPTVAPNLTCRDACTAADALWAGAST
ncbi:hypothetical protein [Streptomyces europaeiscabiei]|uniref:hypothetical protein n=1 Tax=Streptomyces europaeiscabiei TaxID=146819 RepID=UPI0029C9C32F|nr:hypothetical protein [Streptomyces europaeiscabiei]